MRLNLLPVIQAPLCAPNQSSLSLHWSLNSINNSSEVNSLALYAVSPSLCCYNDRNDLWAT